MKEQEYAGCWYCDNIIDHPEQVGLLHLGFPEMLCLNPIKQGILFLYF